MSNLNTHSKISNRTSIYTQEKRPGRTGIHIRKKDPVELTYTQEKATRLVTSTPSAEINRVNNI